MPRILRNYDVASLYPSLIINEGYMSRNVESAKEYEEIRNRRIEAKHSGDKALSNTLKLVLNTTFGAMLNPYNDLYDPKNGRSITISGQLYLTMLVMMYREQLKSLKIINFNTDGVLISIDDSEEDLVKQINDQWQQQTGLVLEEERIKKVVQKDVNNYFILYEDGKTKVKGSYLTYGVQWAGAAWSINNSCVIVKKALHDHFARGTPIEETIKKSTDIFDFQFIANAGSKYSEVFQKVGSARIPCQKVNRVYASKDIFLGTLYKVKKEDGSIQKIESLPPHCIIDNQNVLSIEDIDKSFYTKLAYERLNDFLGIKEKSKSPVGLRKLKKILKNKG